MSAVGKCPKCGWPRHAGDTQCGDCGAIINPPMQLPELLPDQKAYLDKLSADAKRPIDWDTRIVLASLSSCNCDTKSPALEYHHEICRFRVLMEARALLHADRLEGAAVAKCFECDDELTGPICLKCNAPPSDEVRVWNEAIEAVRDQLKTRLGELANLSSEARNASDDSLAYED